MSYTIKSLQKALTLLEDELEGLGHVSSKNHIQDMYLQFQMLAERVSIQQAKNCQNRQSFELE